MVSYVMRNYFFHTAFVLPMSFRVKVLKMYKIYSGCHIKTCRSFKVRTILNFCSVILLLKLYAQQGHKFLLHFLLNNRNFQSGFNFCTTITSISFRILLTIGPLMFSCFQRNFNGFTRGIYCSYGWERFRGVYKEYTSRGGSLSYVQRSSWR